MKSKLVIIKKPCNCGAASELSSSTGSDASISPEMSNDELAAKLLCVLSQEMIRKADLFDYLCWLEEKEQSERVPGADFLVLASDGSTCWDDRKIATGSYIAISPQCYLVPRLRLLAFPRWSPGKGALVP